MTASLHLDGLNLTSESELHDEVERQLKPPVYGRNLDALWDVIGAMLEPPIEILWTHARQSKSILGERFESFVRVFRDAEAEYGQGEYTFMLRMDD